MESFRFAIRLSGAAAIAVAAYGVMDTRLVSRVEAAPPTGFGSPARCQSYAGKPSDFGLAPHAGMVRIPAGEFEPGSWSGYADEAPVARVEVNSFWMDRTEVTNAQFAAFVKATGYKTEAEREGGAAVFKAPARNAAVLPNSWWSYVHGANWRHPEGPGSSLSGRDNRPVVLVTQADARAYAAWLGRDLPTEAEWEWAARGGGSAEQVEREPRSPEGRPMANYWQGLFPSVNTQQDGYAAHAPVGCFPANGYGLHDLIGNVWEWTQDPYTGARQPHGNGEPELVRAQRKDAPMGVIKGGSFLCAADYCQRYRAAARHPQERTLGVSHVGFRTVARH